MTNTLTDRLFLHNRFDTKLYSAVYKEGETYCVKNRTNDVRRIFNIKDNGDVLLHRHILKGALDIMYKIK